MSDKIDWAGLPMAMPGGQMLPHLSARLRTAMVDQVFYMMGGVERFADWANRNPGEYYTKIYAKGMAKPISVEVQTENSLEALIEAADAAKLVNAESEPVTIEDIIVGEPDER